MRSAILRLVTAVALSSPAAAQDLPNYDVEKFCAKIAEATGGMAILRSSCIWMEQVHYDALTVRWASLPETVRTVCTTLVTAAGGSYQYLGGCVHQEMTALGANLKFQR